MKIKYLILPLVCTIFSANILAQKLNYEISDNANKMFDLGNFQRAKELYRDKYKKDLTDVKVKYKFGVCLANTYELADAIKILESISSKPSTPIEVWYHLARAYHLSNRYEKAITLYKKYNNSNGAKTDLIEKSKRNIEMCDNAKIIIKKPLNIKFENLGKRVNSAGREYLPMITPDESMLLYTTRRQGTTGRIYDLKGYYTADIFLAKYKYGKWSKARSIGSPNSYGNEQTAGISENGKYVLYHVNNPNSKNNLQLSKKSRSSFKRSIKIKSKAINNGSSIQMSATISNDGNYLIFSSDKADSYGRQDLYICRKLPNGEWAEPLNMGPTINTTFDESYPYLSDNGYTLHFASTGHNSIGGYDIFISHFDLSKKEWSKPRNIGYPLNTPYNNTNITFSENHKYAYVSTHRKDSYGDLDIYRVDFIDTPPSYTTIKGYVLDTDSNLFNTTLTIEVFNKKTDELYGIYEVNPTKGNYIMILPPNNYEINIDVPGKGYFKQAFIVAGRNKYKKELKRNITVSFDSEEPNK
ncbi:MAG: PD40 domain-containing protein [Flavobacteriales bacterium]|nr:PD40 domain-containing protein [Flavobacteriales bacterium]